MTNATFDLVDFRNAMARFPSGLTVVITSTDSAQPVGFTASAFSSLSLNPPLVLVCLDKRAECYQAFMAASMMTISVLAADQADLALRFATKQIDKFAGTATTAGPVSGLPLIEAASVQLECRMQARPDGGDHVILVGEVLGVAMTGHAPMVHFDRRFGQFAEAQPVH